MSRASTRTPQSLLITVSRVLDGVSILTLIATDELHPQWGMFITAIAITAYLARGRRLVSQPFLIFLMLSVIFGSVAVWPKFKLHPLIVASHSAPLTHSLVWFGSRTVGHYGARLALGFLEIALAAAVSPEISVAAGIFAYFIGASLLLICLHLWSERSEYAPEQLRSPIPKRVLGFSVLASTAVLGASVLIFPFLPRIQSPWSSPYEGGAGNLRTETETGYTERAGLEGNLNWSKGGSGQGEDPVLRIFLPEEDWTGAFPLGLLRMRVLGLWNDGQFIADPKNDRPSAAPRTTRLERPIHFSAIREPLGSESLPAPYGATSLAAPALIAPQTEAIYRMSGIQNRRVAFQFDAASIALPMLGSESAQPMARDSEIPALVSDRARWERLSEVLTLKRSESESLRTRLARLQDYFVTVGFKAGHVDSADDGRSKLERFMFEKREGHCEWFAMSSLVLLRLQGIPARLVSGFRISSPPWGSVLTIRQKDSHLWLEAWDQKIGRWIPFDPAPRVRAQTGTMDSILGLLRDSRSWASSTWYRWILSPGTDPESLLESRGSSSPFTAFGRSLEWKNIPRTSDAWREAAQRGSKWVLGWLGPWTKTMLLILAALALWKGAQSWKSMHWSRRDLRVQLPRLASRIARLLRRADPALERQRADALLELRFSGLSAHALHDSTQRRHALRRLWQVVRDYWLGSV